MVDSGLAARFVERLYGRQRAALLTCGRKGYLTLVAASRTQRLIIHLDITQPSWLDLIRETTQESVDLGADLYFGNALRRSDLGPYGQGKQQPQQLLSLGHLFAEADYASGAPSPSLLGGVHASTRLAPREAVLASLMRFSPKPDVVISSGHGLHCYWLLQDPLWLNEQNFNQVKKVSLNWQKGFQAHFAGEGIAGIDSIMNLDRVLRMPGSINFKNGQQRPVGLLWGLEE